MEKFICTTVEIFAFISAIMSSFLPMDSCRQSLKHD
jgi:hypothetical protein